MALGDYQKITRVVSGKPFGNGSDGAYSSATIPTMVNESCSGAAAGTALTCGSTGLTDGDIILIHQSRGTGVGQWEVNKVASGGGTTSIVLSEALNYTYTDSGASQAQVTVIKQYTDVTVETGTWTLPGWGGDQGGILTFAAKGTLTVTGSINGNGSVGTNGDGTSPSAGGGYLGGVSDSGANQQAGQGEGTSGARNGESTSANGSGAGGGYSGNGQASGGGGGNGAAGSDGTDQASATVKGAGGGSAGSADLLNAVFGGAGGGSATQSDPDTGSGGNGGGAIFVFCKDASLSGVTSVNGGAGGSSGSTAADNIGGGGGAGGSVIIICATATLGTNKITSTAGAGGVGFIAGGAGGVGRNAVHHSGTVTGTTNPTFSDTEDSSLVETTASSGATGSFHFM